MEVLESMSDKERDTWGLIIFDNLLKFTKWVLEFNYVMIRQLIEKNEPYEEFEVFIRYIFILFCFILFYFI